MNIGLTNNESLSMNGLSMKSLSTIIHARIALGIVIPTDVQWILVCERRVWIQLWLSLQSMMRRPSSLRCSQRCTQQMNDNYRFVGDGNFYLWNAYICLIYAYTEPRGWRYQSKKDNSGTEFGHPWPKTGHPIGKLKKTCQWNLLPTTEQESKLGG